MTQWEKHSDRYLNNKLKVLEAKQNEIFDNLRKEKDRLFKLMNKIENDWYSESKNLDKAQEAISKILKERKDERRIKKEIAKRLKEQ